MPSFKRSVSVLRAARALQLFRLLPGHVHSAFVGREEVAHLECRGTEEARVFYKSERTKVFTLCQQAVSSPASRGRKGETGKESELRRWGEKVIGVDGGGVTSVASQARPQISQARGSAECELTAGAMRSMPPGD